MQEPNYDVPPQRKAGFFVGLGLLVLGVILFLSVFVSGAMHFGDFSDFEERSQNEAMRSIIGMILMIVGIVTAIISRAGLAGSGLTMNPRGMRKDLEPWNRAAGGMLGDTLEEANLGKHLSGIVGGSPKEVVKVRCPHCAALNDEGAKFCNQCGNAF